MVTGDGGPHFVLIPLMAQGHMIPMVDMARLFAARGVLATVITTPANASRFRAAVDLAADAGLPVRLVELPFPCREAGLPDGCENLDALPSPDLIANFFSATAMLRPAAEQYLESLQPPASCIVSDMGLPWTSKTAQHLGHNITRDGVVNQGGRGRRLSCSSQYRFHERCRQVAWRTGLAIHDHTNTTTGLSTNVCKIERSQGPS